MAHRIAVLLAGCGVFDGSEIQEVVCTLLALERAGAEAYCLAPDLLQRETIDHLAGRPVEDQRRVLVESARIVRGEIEVLEQANPDDFAALVVPGGFGVAKNLCSFAVDGAACTVDEGVSDFLHSFHEAGKPIGAMCIAPALIARVLGGENPVLTIGCDAEVAAALEAMGAEHHRATPTDIVIDTRNRIVSCPCYMSATSVGQIADGTDKLVRAVLDMLA